jgi:hypothetical protein
MNSQDVVATAAQVDMQWRASMSKYAELERAAEQKSIERKREQSKGTQEMSEFSRAGQWSFGYVRNKEKEARRRQRRGLIER